MSEYIENLRNTIKEKGHISNNEAIKVIETEIECVRKAVKGCKRNCEKCDLVLDDILILDSYDKAISALKHIAKYRKAYKRFKRKYLFLKCGIKRALNEMERASDYDAYDKFQLGVNYGLMSAFEMLELYTTEDKN